MVDYCVICGAPFERTRKQLTCSEACGHEKEKARRREIDRAKREGWYEPKSLRAKSPKSPHPAWTDPHQHETQAERDRATREEAAWIMCQG